MHILVIDDDPLMTKFYERAFEGKQIITFNKPDEGYAYFLKTLCTDPPEVVILDAVYSGQWAIPTGYDMAKKMRKEDKDKRLAIVMVTANKRSLDDLRINEEGVDAIFYKGEIEEPVLVAEIEKMYLEKRRANDN